MTWIKDTEIIETWKWDDKKGKMVVINVKVIQQGDIKIKSSESYTVYKRILMEN